MDNRYMDVPEEHEPGCECMFCAPLPREGEPMDSIARGMGMVFAAFVVLSLIGWLLTR